MKLIKNLDSEIFRKFNQESEIGNMLQSEEWGIFKSKGFWKYELLGFEKDQKLVGALMLLRRKLPVVNKYMFYATRGFLTNYKDLELVKEITNELVIHAKKENGILLKIDPCIIYRERDWEGELVEGGEDNKKLVEFLKNIGYKHKGISLNFDGIQPRFVYKLPLNSSLNEILKKCHHKTRYNIKLATKKGVEILEGNKSDLKEFTRIMKITGERDGFITRPLSYFEEMYDTMHSKGMMKLYLAKYNVKDALDKDIEDLKKEKEKKKPDENRINKLEREIPELEKLYKDNKDGIIVSGTIMIISGKTACYLYGASDNLYRNIMPNYLIQWRMIEDAYNLGCTMYDFRGISGDRSESNPLYGLYRFKKGFNGEFVEYIGEFDYIISKFWYFAFNFMVPKIKKMIKLLKK